MGLNLFWVASYISVIMIRLLKTKEMSFIIFLYCLVGRAGGHPGGVGLARGQRLLQVPHVNGEADVGTRVDQGVGDLELFVDH